MSKDALRTLAGLTPGINAYSDEGHAKKRALHRDGQAFLRRLALDLGLGTDERDIRSNLGGIAVSGEVTLHADRLYVQLSESCVGEGGVSVLYRSCQGRKDYSGGRNHSTTAQALQQGTYPSFVATCRTLMASVNATPAAPRP